VQHDVSSRLPATDRAACSGLAGRQRFTAARSNDVVAPSQHRCRSCSSKEHDDFCFAATCRRGERDPPHFTINAPLKRCIWGLGNPLSGTALWVHGHHRFIARLSLPDRGGTARIHQYLQVLHNNAFDFLGRQVFGRLEWYADAWRCRIDGGFLPRQRPCLWRLVATCAHRYRREKCNVGRIATPHVGHISPLVRNRHLRRSRVTYPALAAPARRAIESLDALRRGAVSFHQLLNGPRRHCARIVRFVCDLDQELFRTERKRAVDVR